MRLLQNILLAAFVTSTSILSAGCGDDCTVYCRNQANLIEQCLPQFEQGWSDVGEGDWDNRGQFVAGCVDQIDEYIEQDVEETCDSDNDETYQDCQRTVREAAVRSCGDHLNDFRRSCSDYWRGVLDFTPAAYDPEPLPEGDDDDSAGDDDDSAGDDDDSTGDDDDSAGDDDDSTGDDDDDSAADDDDSAGDDDDDDDSADDDDAADDDDDSAGDDDDAADDDDDSAGDDDDSSGV